MPLARGRDSGGPYYRWGPSGHAYHYTSADALSRGRAKAKALRQGRAIEASKHRRLGGAAAAARPAVRKKPRLLSSAARAEKKTQDRTRPKAVAAYRRVGK